MQVVMVCESATVDGGAEKVAIQESLELRRRGWRVGFISGGSNADPRLTEAGIELLLLDTTSFFEEPRRSAKFQRMFYNAGIENQVSAFLASFANDKAVVHLHTFRLKLSGVVGHIAQKLGFPTLLHAHDYSPACPTSLYYDHREKRNCDRRPLSLSCIACECQDQLWKYKLPKVTSHWWNQSVWNLTRRSSGIIHISDLERQTLAPLISATLPAFHLPPISSLAAKERVVAERNQNLLCIGRLTYEKGVDAFLKACQQTGQPAVVIGDGPKRRDFESEFTEAEFAGWLGSDEIERALQSARSVVVPSRWRETLGLSVIDAMTLGVPCVVSDNVGAKEYIRDGVNGLISSESDLAKSLARLSDDTFVENISRAAFADIQEKPMTVENHVDSLESIYRSCLNKDHAS